ncbi:uncharacterized protein LOC123312897 isoform X2 [Coccinella septempunctata]|uniref:uncharacterized protein LOC123312897 isoform X2 n=1 Tax=Coccinella septempunctata TaxID=41139 RepID=UPI001D087862|nr:uncharacterized protein LOC123312897 isoform X2 [Coccinella septempunctata]
MLFHKRNIYGDVTTRSPDVIGEGGQLTLALFLIVAVVAITLLFALGIFIDCRHQKIDDEEAQRKKDLRKMRLKIPKMNKKAPKRDDKDCIVENMEENEEASTSNSIV